MNENTFLKNDHFISDYVLLGTDLDVIKEKKETLTKQQKEAWKEVYSFAHLANRSGRKWSPTDVKHLCEQFLLSKEKVEKVFLKVFSENKDEHGINEKPDIYKVEVFLNKNWDFRKNEITQIREYKKKDSDDFEVMNEDTIYRKLEHAGLKYSLDKLKSLMKSDFVPSHDPFKDYFNNLEPWDGKIDYISKLASYVSVEDQDFFTTQFKKCLVRCIGCSLYGVENRIVFVLVQEKQSTGKSTFIRFLCPFGDKYITEAPIHNNKDSSFALAENFIYNIEELATATNMDVARLKSFISTFIVKERKPHATNVIQQPRRANIFGSTNKLEFLTDTENTRWLCFNLKAINWKYKSDVDISKVWSQAYSLYHDKSFNDQLTKEESGYRDLKNKDYEINDYEKELIKRHFQVCSIGEGQFYSNADILDTLQFDVKTKLETRFISKNMVQLGFERGSKKMNGHKVRGYFAKKLISEYKQDGKVL